MTSFQRFVVGCIVAVAGTVFIPASAQAASLSLSPPSKTVAVGDTITVTIVVDTAGQSINDAQATLTFPSNLLEFKELTTTESIFSYWTLTPVGSNIDGQVVFAGGLPTPGYTGSTGTVLTATWQAIKAGQAEMTITKAQVLANDGQGTDVLTEVGNGRYTVTDAKDVDLVIPTITSATHQDPRRWYPLGQATVSWTRPPGLLGVSYALDHVAITSPDDILEPNTGTVTLTLPTDGTWYFHVRSRYASGWIQTAHYTLRADQTPPEPFTLELIRDRSESDPTPQIAWHAADLTSGVARSMISLDGQPATAAVSPAVVAITKQGQHRVMVTTYDGAGNIRQSEFTFTTTGYPTPTISFISTPLILLEPLVIKGLSTAGDTVTIFVNGREQARVQAGQIESVVPGVLVRLPWTWQSQEFFGPGNHQVTVSATSADGQTSVQSDPRPMNINGSTVRFAGRPLATIAVVPAVSLLFAAVVVMIMYVMVKLIVSIVHLHRQEVLAEVEVLDLERHVRKGDISTTAIAEKLEIIANELDDGRNTKKIASRRSVIKR